MKLLLLIVSLGLGGAIANGNPVSLSEYFIGDFIKTDDFIYLSSLDCGSVFYRPLNYRYVPNMSSTLKGKNSVHVLAVLEPTIKNPSAAEKNYVSKKLAHCKDKEISFRPHPAMWTSLKIKGVAGDALPDDRWLFKLEKTGGSEGIPFLEDPQNAPSMTLKAVRKKIARKASLYAISSVAAEFLQRFWEERSCTVREKKVLSFIEKDEHCEGIQKVAQHLRSLDFNGLIMLSTLSESLSSPRVAQMEKKLLSRLALSSFVWQQQQKFENITTVTFGELKKSPYDTYYDEIIDEEIVKESFDATAKIYGLETIGIKP